MSKTQILIDGLNHALNREVTTFLRYMMQAARIKGIENAPVRAMYQSEVTDEVGHATDLADRIVMLGGVPKLDPEMSKIPDNVRDMLRNDIAEEQKDVAHYMKLAELAEKCGEFDLKLRMEEQASDEAGHAREMRRLLGD